jgi:hypothetical protein
VRGTIALLDIPTREVPIEHSILVPAENVWLKIVVPFSLNKKVGNPPPPTSNWDPLKDPIKEPIPGSLEKKNVP